MEKIDTDELTRIVGTLAADDMAGRQAGTPGAQKASHFIAAEFEKAGLTPFGDSDSFLQPFTVYQLEPVRHNLTLDGENVSPGDFVALARTASFRRDGLEGMVVHHAGPNDDLRRKMRSLLSSPSPVLLLLDPVHRPALGFMRRFVGRNPLFELNPERTLIAVITQKSRVDQVTVDIENKVEERTLANVVGVLPGRDRADEIVLFSAHYDHLGNLPEKDGDSIANGADDDASGVAGIIALARYFKHADRHRRTLVFAAFTAEEIGGFGSQYLAGIMDPERIVAGVNLEMIGKVSDFGPGNGYMTGFEHSNLGEIMQRNLEGSGQTLHPDPHRQNLFFRSDNINFAKLGVPAHSFSTGPIDRDPYYHTVDDELSTLDMAHMTRFLRGLAQALGTIVSGEDTPGRISL